MTMAKKALLLALVLAFPACSRDAPPEPPAASSAPPETPKIRFLERVTGGADANEPLPLVVAIHGFGADPESFGRLLEGFEGRVRLILPYGTSPQGEGFSWFPLAGFDPTLLAQGSERAANGLAAMILELERTRPTRGKPIVTGFSQGGILSFTLAVKHPERIGEALPVAGMLAPPLLPTSWPMGKFAPPIHAFHGDADGIVPMRRAADSVRALVAVGFSADLKTYPGVEHTVSAAMRRDYFEALEAAATRAAASSP